jgi:hypothetical protein
LEIKIISLENKTGFNPSVSPDRKKILYFGGELKSPHFSYLNCNVVSFEKEGFSEKNILTFEKEFK